MRNDYIYDDGGRHHYFRMKYKKDRVGDCVVRALALASGEDYHKVWRELCWTGYQNGYLPNERQNYEAFLEKRGFIPMKAIRGYTLGSYPLDHDEVYVISVSHHLVCIDEGLVRDLWDCRGYKVRKLYRKPKV